MKKDSPNQSTDDVFADELAERAGRRLRASADDPDSVLAARLAAARRRALDEMPETGRGRRPAWLPAAALAASAVLAIGIWSMRGDDAIEPPVMAEEPIDFELLMDDSDPEMFAELEFYAWLSDEELGPPG